MSQKAPETDILAEIITSLKTWLQDVLPAEWVVAWVPDSDE